MIKRGLVSREECAEDGRAAFVGLTPAGLDAVRTAAARSRPGGGQRAGRYQRQLGDDHGGGDYLDL
jgi:DNA-binding MarR family transcriptional regulator